MTQIDALINVIRLARPNAVDRYDNSSIERVQQMKDKLVKQRSDRRHRRGGF